MAEDRLASGTGFCLFESYSRSKQRAMIQHGGSAGATLDVIEESPATLGGDDILLFMLNAKWKVVKSSSLGGYAR